eukprot:TRINITY_DN67021_c0_g1_i1.p1 TRINITY_DN67021_c0_g1~~TRINITY_DN67021_c0_g1_i1.p1  ORF type:complete len:275 (+),score=33.40 TRINITY_DN67021_c0_g1_i1:105-827(+)
MAGALPATCHRLRDICTDADLCSLVFARDLADENHCQPRPSSGVQMARLSEDVASDEAAGQLAELATRLINETPARIAWLAASEGRPALLAWAARRTPLVNIDQKGSSALMIAAALDWPRTTAIAAAFCDIDLTRSANGSALHMAAFTGAISSVHELCKLGADLELRNLSYYQTPLMVASSRGKLEVVRTLLHFGANVDVRDKDGFTPADIARWKRNHAVEQLLQSHEAAHGRPPELVVH